MNRAAFYSAIRPAFGGKLDAGQAQGLEILLTATEGLPVSHRAYLLATAKHETAHTMQPIHERGKRAYFDKYEPGTKIGARLGNTAVGDGFRFRGRGYVQLTGRGNYDKAGRKLGLNLVAGPDAALSPPIAAKILIAGCEGGWFTGKKLSDYLPGDYVNARRVVNGTDKAKEIAALAVAFEKALGFLGGIEVQEPKPATPPRNDPKAFGLVWLIKFIVQGIGLLTWRRK